MYILIDDDAQRLSPAMRLLAEDENRTVQTNDCTDALPKTGFSFDVSRPAQHDVRRMSEACTAGGYYQKAPDEC